MQDAASVIRSAQLRHAASRLAARGSVRGEERVAQVWPGRPDRLSEVEEPCADSLAKQLNTASRSLRTTGSMLCGNWAPTHLWLRLSGRCLLSPDPLGACKKSFSAIWQPGVVWCKNMFINSHTVFQAADRSRSFYFSMHRHILLTAKGEDKVKRRFFFLFFLMSLLTFKIKFEQRIQSDFVYVLCLWEMLHFGGAHWGSVCVTDKSAFTVCWGCFRISHDF